MIETIDTDAVLAAAHSGNLETVKKYLDAGGDLEASNSAGFTPLLVAIEGRRTELASWLIDKGANVHARLSTGFTALHILTKHFRNRPLNFSVTVKRGGKDVTLTDPDEIRRETGGHPDDELRALLSCAVKLLDKGFDLSVASGPKQTPPLRYAAEVDTSLAMVLLEKANPDVNAADTEGFTALHMAGRRGEIALTDALLERGASVDPADEFGFTPLHEALMGGHKIVAERLLKSGASPTRTLTRSYDRYAEGDTAAEIAKKSGHPELLASLKERG